MTFRSPKLLRAARDQTCTLCFVNDGTVVAAHGPFEKGIGMKAPDCCIAFLCHKCHAEVDGRTGMYSQEERQLNWARAYVRTMMVLFEQNIVVVK